MKSKTLFLLFVISWMIPIAVLLSFIFNQYQNAYIDRTESEVMNAVDVSGVLMKSHIDEAAYRIRRQTTSEEWRTNYRKVQTGEMSIDDYLTWIHLQVVSKFATDDQFTLTAFYLNTVDEPLVYSGEQDYPKDDYIAKVDGSLKSLIQGKEKKTQVAIIDGRMYLVQNLFFSIYNISYGAVVIGLKTDALFKDIPLDEMENIFVEVGKSGSLLTYYGDETIPDIKMDALNAVRSGADDAGNRAMPRTLQRGYAGYRYSALEDSYELDLYYIKDMKDLYYEITRVNLIVIVSVLAMIPVMVLTYYYMNKNSKYIQKMATKDAQIAALQAQINPHFLNNTLEMMNWQARMNGDTEVCKMIESLGTVLASGINRDNDMLVRLSDEIRCADAFLYIMSMRFGDRLEVEKLVDTNLTNALVPQLILQPILENAIKHGVESVSHGTIWLNIFEEDQKLIIDVINSGKKMTSQDIDRIERIITGEEKLNKSVPGVHTSIGIYNVNKRIELIFGQGYGLSVHLIDEDKMQFRMIMPRSGRRAD
ncbi:sensor histidine kinase [Butyrivibrio fibrisolvens]|uniref:sensor histidine kinase n=1 Tax=Butyrivibrio fibrisolvens TaxID=831 RepID=UPI00042238DE|nr:histidine kinase [Butyrivibrio fibrisolvens]